MRNLTRLHRMPFTGYWATYSTIVNAMWGQLGTERMPQWVFIARPYARLHRAHARQVNVLRLPRHA